MVPPVFMFVAGEPSGDQHAAVIMRELHLRCKDAVFFGIGGKQMQAQGLEPLLPFEDFNRGGYSEVLAHIGFFIHAKKIVLEQMHARKPSVVVCIDYSGFNTPIMKAAHRAGIAVVWYIAPKIWVWKKKKHTSNLRNYADFVGVIFPFEEDLFKPLVPQARFVGNPSVEYYNSLKKPVIDRTIHTLQNADTIRLALVPGSRKSEVEHMLPLMIAAVQCLSREFSTIRAIISRCSHIPHTLYEKSIDSNSHIEFFDGPLEALFSSTDIGIIKSGTSTLEAGLAGLPMVIVYKIPILSYVVIKALISRNLRFVGLPNIISRRLIVPELLQKKLNPDSLSYEVKRFIREPSYYTSVHKQLLDLRNALGSKKPSYEVTQLILQAMR